MLLVVLFHELLRKTATGADAQAVVLSQAQGLPAGEFWLTPGSTPCLM